MWKLYGKSYDLTSFAQHHPGGAEIIEKTKGLEDCTALFESYHAFSDLESIKQSLDKYEKPLVADDDTVIVNTYNTDFTTYYKLIEKIKEVFPDRASVKAPPSWYLFVSVIGCAYMYLLYHMIMNTHHAFLQCILAFISSTMEVSLLFNILHDSSHYAITTDYKVNTAFSIISQSWTIWNHSIWYLHHVILHHSFTGDEQDPDKYLYEYAHMIDISHLSPSTQHLINTIIFAFFPGQHTLQSFLYAKRAFNKYTTHKYYCTTELAIIFCKILFLCRIGILPAIFYVLNLNVLYYINIFPNHDLYDTYNNHYDGPDWAKRQICNSGNFANQYKWWSMIFGGINHQIEHHLFPNMSNHHYPTIAPIVKKFCQDNDLPYVHEPTLESAYQSFMKRIVAKKEQ
uniref:Cytochrome b5 heme-binding domain-containing protein n=1 Tax=viral metagenome TaxID=1070528 RepID=A0A6C0KM19_9ZZZZ